MRDPAVALIEDEALYTSVVGDVLDRLGYTTQFLPAPVRAVQTGMRVVGRAMPVRLAAATKVRGQGLGALMAALDELHEGEVYLASGGDLECAAWGELMTAAARHRGAAGAVLNAYHRDTDRILEQRWPVFSRGAYAQDAAVRSVVVGVREPLDVGGVDVSPGDLVLGDRDGVLVVPRAVEEEVLRLAVEKAGAEARVRAAIDGGLSAPDAFREFRVF